MKVVHKQPWFRPLLRLFGLGKEGAIYTWGKTVYTPGPLTEDLLTHEAMHMVQQAGFFGATRWWIKYVLDKTFRQEQEVEAYAAQMNYIRDRVPRRVALRFAYAMAETLAADFYGLGLTHAEALALIVARSGYRIR